MVFLSKMLGMLPVIWTEDESESECKSYFNLYTFAVFIGKVWFNVLLIEDIRAAALYQRGRGFKSFWVLAFISYRASLIHIPGGGATLLIFL